MLNSRPKSNHVMRKDIERTDGVSNSMGRLELPLHGPIIMIHFNCRNSSYNSQIRFGLFLFWVDGNEQANPGEENLLFNISLP